MQKSIFGIEIFQFFRIDSVAAQNLQRFLASILETYIEEGEVPIILYVSKGDFKLLAQAYVDLLTGYRHPRVSSLAFRFRQQDPTLRKLSAIFPAWLPATPAVPVP